MSNMRKYIQTNIDHFQVLSHSTNKVLAFSYKGKDYILKKQALPEDGLSPFWQMMKDVFGSSFQKQRACMENICALLKENPHIPVAKLALVEEEEKLQVFEKMAGSAWEPDVFPERAAIAYQLGLFIGFNHSRSYDGIKLPGAGMGGCLKERIIRHMENTISRHWSGEDALGTSVREYFEKLKTMDVSCDELSLIMADLSANQFLFDGDKISACVDLDAYVLGPRAWELALVHNCLKDMESFKRGYEAYLTWPDMKGADCFFGFLMALNDVWEKEEMRRHLGKDGLLKEEV